MCAKRLDKVFYVLNIFESEFLVTERLSVFLTNTSHGQHAVEVMNSLHMWDNISTVFLSSSELTGELFYMAEKYFLPKSTKTIVFGYALFCSMVKISLLPMVFI